LENIGNSSAMQEHELIMQKCSKLFDIHQRLICIFLEVTTTSTWLGGASFHGDTFSSIYISLVICNVLAPYMKDQFEKTLHKKMIELQKGETEEYGNNVIKDQYSKNLHPLVQRMIQSLFSIKSRGNKSKEDWDTDFLFLRVHFI